MAIYDNRICKGCNAVFSGGPRAWYCPACRRERQLRQCRESKRRERLGITRKIGSVDICQNCGAKYYIKSANQKFCEKCAGIMYKKIDRAMSLKYYYERVDKRERSIKRRKYYAQNKVMLNAKRRLNKK